MQLLLPFLEAENPKFVLTNGGGRLSMKIQKHVGDILVQNGRLISIEVKVEKEDKHENFFLETWSNRKWFTPGWMYTTDCDRLWYFFLKERKLYSIDFGRLRQWAFWLKDGRGPFYSYKEKKQKEYEQNNDTWGRCVPIDVIREAIGFERECLVPGLIANP